jgi:hypothetical protein
MTLQTNNNNLDITKLAYEKINDRYYKAKYGEFDVIMDMTTGFRRHLLGKYQKLLITF